MLMTDDPRSSLNDTARHLGRCLKVKDQFQGLEGQD